MTPAQIKQLGKLYSLAMERPFVFDVSSKRFVPKPGFFGKQNPRAVKTFLQMAKDNRAITDDEAEMLEMYEDDAKDFDLIAVYLSFGDFAAINDKLNSMDTSPREEAYDKLPAKYKNWEDAD